MLTIVLFVRFHYTVRNVLKARYTLDLNVNEVCIKFGLLNTCEEVNNSRYSRDSFYTSNINRLRQTQ